MEKWEEPKEVSEKEQASGVEEPQEWPHGR